MRALVFADRSAAALAPLDRRYAVPLLPVAGKALILYTVEELVAAGITDCVFVLSEHADRVEALLGGGERWGARFRVVLSRGDEAPSALWPRISLGGDAPLLVLRGDLLRSPVVAEFLALAQGRAGRRILGAAADPRASLLLLRPDDGADGAPPAALLDLLAVGPADADGASGVAADSMPLPDGDLNLLPDLRAYHRANLDLVAGSFRGLAPAGREVALGLVAGRRAQVSPRSLRQGHAYVGDNSRVSAEAELLGNVVIARDVIVDRAATLYDSVILPHSYIGELVEVGNAIIAGDQLIRVDTGVVVTISDAFLLGNLGQASAAPGVRVIDRVAGALLALLSLPLWPLALGAAALARPAPATATETDAAGSSTPVPVAGRRGLWQTELLIGNRRSSLPAAGESDQCFSSLRFATPIPVLALLPRLLAVPRGVLRLVGVAPLTPQESESRSEDWQRVRDQAPVGLLGPTQLLLPADAPLDERLMSDAFYAGQRSDLKDLRWLWEGLRGLFSARAWRTRDTDGDRRA
jgi:NDP-sugar pyrophosphorylase family protein